MQIKLHVYFGGPGFYQDLLDALMKKKQAPKPFKTKAPPFMVDEFKSVT